LWWYTNNRLTGGQKIRFQKTRQMTAVFDSELTIRPPCRPGDRVQVALMRSAYGSLAQFASNLIDGDKGVGPLVRINPE
jgi:hypothetical protein